MDIFDYGDYGNPLRMIDGCVCATMNPSGSIRKYKIGDTGCCMHVDSAGSLLVRIEGGIPGASGYDPYRNQDLGPQITGSNNEFILDYVPQGYSALTLYWNGIKLKGGDGLDYTLQDGVITTNFIPYVDNDLLAVIFIG